MAYAIDDEWENGPMLRRAGTAAFGLYCVCGLWVARHHTDGFVPADVAASYGTREWAAKLIDAGLWEAVEGGYRDPWYLGRNPSAEQVRARRRADAERKARWRDTQHRVRGTPDGTRESGGSPTATPQGFRASYSPPKGGRAGAAPRSALQVVADWCGRCDKDRRVEVDEQDHVVPCSRCHPRRTA